MLPYSLFLLITTSDTISGSFTVTDSPYLSTWDEGASTWTETERNTTQNQTQGEWATGTNRDRTSALWDTPERAHWDANDVHWMDAAPAWDMAEQTDERTWIVGKAGRFGGNVRSATGVLHTARIWIRPHDPATPAAVARRQVLRDAVAAWTSDSDTCTRTAKLNQPGEYASDYHRWLAYYLKTH